MVRPRMPSGAGNLRPQQRAFAQPHLVERLRAAGIADLRRIAAEIEHAERHAGHVGIHQQVHRTGRLVVGRGGVEDETVVAVRPALARQREAQMERTVAVAVGVDRVGEAVRAVVEGLGEPRAHQLARAREQLAQRIGHDVGAEAADDLLDALHADLRARHQRPHVAACSGRGSANCGGRSSASASLVTPASISLVGGMMMPSWKMSVVSGLIEPAACRRYRRNAPSP